MAGLAAKAWSRDFSRSITRDQGSLTALTWQAQSFRSNGSCDAAAAGPRVEDVVLDRGEVALVALVSLRDAFGLLVIDGPIAVQVEAARAHTCWLVGAGDLIRPWEICEVALVGGARWRVLEQTKVRIVGSAFWRAAQGNPAVINGLLERAARTAHWLLAKSLITSAPNIEDRLLLLFALWGERWGKVTPEGVLLRLPVTHELVANCCGARRPTVSVALGSLREKGFLTRSPEGGWVLTRQPRLDGSCRCWEQYSQALALNPTTTLNGHG